LSALTDDLRQRIVAEFPKYPTKRAVTLPALHLVHEALRCVSPAAMAEIAELLELHPAEVADTMSFYGFFRDDSNPLGRRRVWVCRSLSCMLRGGEDLLVELSERLHCRPGSTSADGSCSLEFAECLGGCDGAPCVLIDDELFLNADADEIVRHVQGAPATEGSLS
jgi:NADH-quinone oxidoreductase subunit E